MEPLQANDSSPWPEAEEKTTKCYVFVSTIQHADQASGWEVDEAVNAFFRETAGGEKDVAALARRRTVRVSAGGVAANSMLFDLRPFGSLSR